MVLYEVLIGHYSFMVRQFNFKGANSYEINFLIAICHVINIWQYYGKLID